MLGVEWKPCRTSRTRPRLPGQRRARPGGSVIKERARRAYGGCAIALAIALGAATSGCSYKLDSFFGKDEKAEQTASMRPTPAPAPAQTAAASPSEHDLAFAKAAAALVLARPEKDASETWENRSEEHTSELQSR